MEALFLEEYKNQLASLFLKVGKKGAPHDESMSVIHLSIDFFPALPQTEFLFKKTIASL